MTRMTEIRLYGHLGRRFGRSHRYAVRSPAEAVRALCCTLPGFRDAVIGEASAPESHRYRVLVGRDPRGPDTLHEPANQIIRIVPVTAGAGRGLGMVIVGALLVALSWYTGGLSLTAAQAWAAGGTALAGYAAGVVGTALVLTGVSMLLAPKIKSEGQKEQPGSHGFDGAENTIGQGLSVPICYGRLVVGSQLVASSMVAEQVSV